MTYVQIAHTVQTWYTFHRNSEFYCEIRKKCNAYLVSSKWTPSQTINPSDRPKFLEYFMDCFSNFNEDECRLTNWVCALCRLQLMNVYFTYQMNFQNKKGLFSCMRFRVRSVICRNGIWNELRLTGFWFEKVLYSLLAFAETCFPSNLRFNLQLTDRSIRINKMHSNRKENDLKNIFLLSLVQELES